MIAAALVIVAAIAAAVVAVWLSLELNPWSLAVLPVSLVLGVLALRLQIVADERAADQPAPPPPTPPTKPRGRHRR